ncbi:MAG TPA: hypothetical protein EYP09_04630 [Anaerolineae bacterium]|nr:hypothetical protein [Anaerolineae bacterium]
MKLVVSIVNSDDARDLLEALVRKGHRATMISTTGGFLREGNATILVGTEDEKVEDVLAVIKENCRARTQYVNPLPPVVEAGELYMPTPVEVQVGGATVFVLDVVRHERF